jgi:hypothetical protein
MTRHSFAAWDNELEQDFLLPNAFQQIFDAGWALTVSPTR